MSVNLGTAVGYLDLDTSKFSMGFKQARSAVDQFKDGTGGVSGMLKGVSQGMSTMGKDLTLKVTTPIVGLGTAAVKTSATFEQSLSKVKAISGATATDMSKLKDKAIEMGAKTKFSATEASDAFTYMAMAGWKTNDMLNSIDGIMNLSAADGLDLATTSDIVTDAMTAFGLAADGTTKIVKDGFTKEVSNASHFADVMAAASSSANTNVSMLGESFKYVAPVAGSLGYSVEDTAVALGLMANSGIKAGQAGTALRAAMTNMVKPTDTMQAVMDRYGISLTNTDGSMKSLSEVMEMLRDKMGGLSEAEQSSAAAALFGKEAMSGMLAIINASPQDYDKLTEAIANADGTAEDMANTMQDNLLGQITILKSNIESLAISIGDMIIPYVKKIVERIQELVVYLNGLDDTTKQHIVQIAMVVAAIGPLLLIVSKVISVVSTVMDGVKLISGALGGLSAPILIVIAAVAALYAAWKTNFMGIGDAINEVAAAIKQTFTDIIETVKSILSTLKQYWDDDFGNIQEITQSVLGAVVDLFKGVLDIVKEVFSFIDNIVKGDFKGAMQNLANIGKIAVDTFIKVFKGIITALALIIANIIKAIAKFAISLGSKMKDAAKNAVEKFVNFMKQLPSKIGYVIGLAIGKVVKFATEFPAKAKEAGKNFVESLINFFKQLPVKIAIWLAKTMAKVTKFKQEFPAKAKEAAKNFATNIVNGIKQLPSKMLSIGKNIIDGVVNGMKAKIESAKESIKGFASGIVKGFKDALGIHSPSKVMKDQVGVQIANGVIAGINSKKGAAKKSASKLSKEIVDAATSKLDVLQTYNKITTAQEVDFWKKIVSATKKGTEAHLTAYKNYKSAQESLNQEILSNAEKRLDKLQTYNKITTAEEVVYWKNVMKQLKKGSDEYLTAYKNYVSAKQSYNEQIKTIESDYNEKVSAVYDNLKTKISDLTKAYNDQVKARKESLLSTFKLFDEYEISSDKNGEDLTNSLQSQVNALQQFNTQMSDLENRKVLPKSLIKELREQGVSATGELSALNSMTDEQLKQYAALWKQRNQLAKDEAERENKDAYDKLQSDIQKAQNAAYKKLDKLAAKYQKKIDKIKKDAYDAANQAGKKTAQGIIDGIESKQASLKNSLQDMLETVNGYVSKIQSGLSNSYSTYKKASKAVSGSHRGGLTYVPYDGYRAMLHEGERVLTKSEASQYNNSNNNNNDVGDIIIPVYIGNDRLDTLIVKASDRNNFRKGGR